MFIGNSYPTPELLSENKFTSIIDYISVPNFVISTKVRNSEKINLFLKKQNLFTQKKLDLFETANKNTISNILNLENQYNSSFLGLNAHFNSATGVAFGILAIAAVAAFCISLKPMSVRRKKG